MVTIFPPVPELWCLITGHKTFFYRTLLCQSEVDLWLFGYKMSSFHHFILLVVWVYKFLSYYPKCVWWGHSDLWPPNSNQFILESKLTFVPHLKKFKAFLRYCTKIVQMDEWTDSPWWCHLRKTLCNPKQDTTNWNLGEKFKASHPNTKQKQRRRRRLGNEKQIQRNFPATDQRERWGLTSFGLN